MRIAFIGGGNMGEAMLSSVLGRGVSQPESVSVSDVSQGRRQYLGDKYGVAILSDNQMAAIRGDVLVLAVKPQNLNEVMAELNGWLKPSQLVLSIVAGTRINTLSLGLNHSAIVRVMPNTPAQIGEGMSVWTATAEVTDRQRGWAASILGAMGREVYVDDEGCIDMATAVSGSGPAYFFYMVESLVEAAVHIGLSLDIARELTLQTMLGSGHLIQRSGRAPAELRRMVTSPGGTTAEAIQQLEEGGFSELLKKAVVAAYEKARRLGE